MKINIDAMKATSLYKLGLANDKKYKGIDIQKTVCIYNDCIKTMNVSKSLKHVCIEMHTSVTVIRTLLKYAKTIGYKIDDYTKYNNHRYIPIEDIHIEEFKQDYYEKSQRDLIQKYGYKTTSLINRLRKEDRNFGKYETRELILIEGCEE